MPTQKKPGKWIARAKRQNKDIYLGTFYQYEQAANAERIFAEVYPAGSRWNRA